MSIKLRLNKLEAKRKGGVINFADELEKLRTARKIENAVYRQMIEDGAPIEEVERIQREQSQAKALERKTKNQNIITDNQSPAFVALAKAYLRATELRA